MDEESIAALTITIIISVIIFGMAMILLPPFGEVNPIWTQAKFCEKHHITMDDCRGMK